MVTHRSRAVFPKAEGDGPALGPTIAALYGFPEPVRVRKLGDGLGSTYIVQAPGRQAVARVSNSSLRPATHLTFELELLASLEARGLPVAGPYRLTDGTLFAVLDDPSRGERHLALYRFLTGHQPRLTLETGLALGRLLAEFHVAAEIVGPPGTLPHLDRRALIEEPVASVKERLTSPTGAETSMTLDSVVGFLARLWPEASSEPGAYGLVHGDSHHLNFLEDDGRLALFDFELLARGWRAYDLATLIWGTFGRGGDAALWDAMVRGYSSVRRLGESEARTVPVFVALRQLWWLGFHARHWGRWRRPWLNPGFFDGGVELLQFIAAQACGYNESSGDE